MKKKLFFLATVLGTYTLSAQTFQPYTTRYGKPLNDAVYDSVYYRGLFGNPDSTTFYDENRRVNIVYNANHLEVSEDEQSTDWWGNRGVWLNMYKHAFTYDAHKNWIGKTTLSWNGSSWDNYQRYIITYNSDNKETSTIYQSWTEATSSWYSGEKDTIIYNPSGNILEAIHLGWNSLTNSFEYGEKWSYTYAGGLIASALFSRYDGANWNQLSRFTYNYTGTNADFILDEYWTGQAWIKMGKFYYDFNNDGQITKETVKSQQNGAWFKSNLTTNNYNADGILKKHTHKVWFRSTETDFSGDQQQYYLHHGHGHAALAASAPANEASNNELLMYPNPSNGTFNVKLANNEQLKMVEVYNAVGEKVFGQKNSEVNLDAAAKGIYFVKIYAGETIYQRKMIIE